MKRMFAFAFALFLLCAVFPLAVLADSETDENTNTCGESLTWTLIDGTLTISGSGKMADYSTSSPAPWYDSRESITKVVIDDGVERIGEYAFDQCAALQDVSIPTSVTGIGNYAFSGCTSLKTVTYPGTSTQWNAIGHNTSNYDLFRAMIYLANGRFITPMHGECNDSISWSVSNKTLTVTGQGAIPDYGYSESPWYDNFTTAIFGDGITRIGDYAFCKRDGMTSQIVSVTIPASVESIGEYAFSGCNALTSITYSGTIAQWEAIKIDTTDFGNTAIMCAAITCTDGTITPEESGTCGDNLTWSLADGVLRITGTGHMDDYGMDYSSDEEDIVMAPWFSLQSKIKSVVIDDGVTYIGSFTFYGCSALKNVVILGDVEEIGYAAFMDCSSLESVVLPKSITRTEGAAFGNCEALKYIYYTGTADEYDNILLETIETTDEKLKNVNRFYETYGCGTVGDLTWSLSADGILSVNGTIPGSDESSPWQLLAEKVQAVSINSDVKSIGTNAFSGLESLQRILYKSTEENWNTVDGHNNVPNDKLYFTYYLGDADMNNTVDYNDCTALLAFLNGSSSNLAGNKLAIAELNSIEGINIGDLQALYRCIKNRDALKTLEVKAG